MSGLVIFVLHVVLALFSLSRAEKICCDELSGCYTNRYPFNNMPLPTCVQDIQPRFNVYRKSGPVDNGEILNRTFIPSNWDPTRRSIFLVHGWIESDAIPWMRKMLAQLLKKEDANIILMDWMKASNRVNYVQSASDTRVLGKELAIISNKLLEEGGTTPDKLYCIGYSLGAHLCGHAGKDTHFGRVTGLDPAGPFFENKHWSVGLNPSAGDLVDVIHTHGDAALLINFGTMKPLGHIDFYPNGGGGQPGCYFQPRDGSSQTSESEKEDGSLQNSESDEEDAKYRPMCSHLRPNPLFTESINSDCQFVARKHCYDAHNIPGSCVSCGDECQVMGFDAEHHPGRGLFYLETNATSPFCLG